eukprot:PhF_6_TR13841/c0_g1_i1/m.22198
MNPCDTFVTHSFRPETCATCKCSKSRHPQSPASEAIPNQKKPDDARKPPVKELDGILPVCDAFQANPFKIEICADCKRSKKLHEEKIILREQERKRKEQEEIERKRKEQEEIERKRKEQEEIERKRKEQEEIERKRKEQEE